MKIVWYVWDLQENQVGMPTLLNSKEAAEKYARLMFPDDSPDERYSRIYFRRVLDLADMKDEELFK